MNAVAGWMLCVFLTLISGTSAFGAFGLTSTNDYYQVDCGSTPSLVFKIRRNNPSSTTSAGDIMSLVYNGVEYQNQSRGSQVNSGFDWIYTASSNVNLSATTVGTDYIKITVVCGNPAVSGILTHYYLVRKGDPRIYMATHFTSEPTGQALCRYILRMQRDKLDNGPIASDVKGTNGTIESGDIYGFNSTHADVSLRGQTRSKHYSGMRLKDWSYIGATGTNVGLWILRDNNEGGSGGPFYRSLINQGGVTNQEITYIVNYGEGQTEEFRPGILNSYTLAFTDGTRPGPMDTSWFSGMGLTGYVGTSGRGGLACASITGRDTRFDYTVGFANDTAQYFTDASAASGSFKLANMLPGTYTMRVYKNELSVYSANVTVSAGLTATLPAIAITGDPSRTVPLWRIGLWDGTPNEFLHGDKVTTMHPSDTRITGTSGTGAWAPGPYVVGSSSPTTGIPCYQWKGVNNSQVVRFNLTAGQVAASTVRIGLTTAFAGGRPNIAVNSWTAGLQGASSQPDSRTLTVGTYRGNNVTYTFSVPASALVVGTNNLTIFPISGSGGSGYLSAGYSMDCIEMSQGGATLSLPGAPANLSATPGGGSVALSWPAVSGAANYLVQRATVSGGPYLTVGEPSSTNFTDAGAGAGTTSYYVVMALNSAGAGLPSPEASAAVPGSAAAVLSLPFDETGGTMAADASGNGWNGTLVGGATFIAGKSGKAVNLSGSDQYVTLPAGVVASVNDFTIATWVKLTASTTGARIFDFGTGTGNSMFLTARSETGRPRLTIRTWRAHDQVIDSSVAIATGTWTHLAVSFTGTTGTIYIKGVPVGTTDGVTLRPYQLGTTTQNYLGRSQADADPTLNGALDDFRIDAKGLTGSEIYTLWGGGGANQPPAFSARPTVFPAVNQGVNYSTLTQTLTTAATDANGGALTFTKLGGPAWLTVAANGALSGTPGNDDVGLNQFSIRVADSSGASDNADLRITVNNVNDPPVWLSTTFTREPVTTGQAYTGTSLAKLAYDVDQIMGDTISFTKISGPSWLTIAANGTLSGTPAVGNVGTNAFAARVTDAVGLTSDATFTIQVVPAILQARYPFDGSGANSQGGSAATIAGTASYTPGVFAQALNFDGSTNFADLGTFSSTTYRDFTAATWMWPNSTDYFQRIFDFGSGTDNYVTLLLAGSSLRFQIVEDGVKQTLDAPVPALGQWAHVAVTLSGSTATIYVNGTAVATSSSITNEPGNMDLISNYLGKSQFAADPLYKGKLDDFRLYNYGLTASEVTALVAAAPSLPPTGLAAAASGTKVTLTWSAVPNAQSYTIKRGTIEGGPYTTVASGVTAATYADQTVASGNTYYYVVSATSTAGESANSNESVAVISDLVAHLKFDETSGAIANDSTGNVWDATLVNAPTRTAGILKNAVNLSGASQYLTLPSGIVSGLNDFTISTWVKVGALSTYSRIFDFGTSTTSNMLLTPQDASTRMRFSIRTSGTQQDISSSTAFAAGTWIHVAVTLSGSTGRLYVNGALVGLNSAMTLKPSSLGSTTLNYLGRSQFTTDPYLNASLDDFRIYSRALSAPEVSTLAYPTAESPENVIATPGDGTVSLSWTVPNAATTYNVKRATASGGPYVTVATGLTTTSFTDTALTNETTYYYVISASNAQGEGPNSASVAVTPTYLRIHLKFDETSGTVAADSSGRGLDAGTVNGPIWEAGKLDNALKLASSSSQYATLPAAAEGLTNFTIMTWVKFTTVVANARIFDFGSATVPGANVGTYMFLTPTGANGIRFGITTAGYNNDKVISVTTPIPTGTWMHVAVTLSGTVGRLYVNGTLMGTDNAMTLNPAILGTLSQNYIGTSLFAADPYLNGSVDDFRIYSRAMGASEVSLFANPLAAPQNVDATSQPQAIALAWTAVPNAATYTVKYAEVAGGPYATLASGLTSPGFTHSGLAYGATCYYVVSASNAAGTSADSTEVNATAASALISAVESASPSLVIGSGSDVVLTTAATVVGHNYQLQTSTDLDSGDWIDFDDPVAGTGSPLQLYPPYDPSEPRRFYRVFIFR